MWRLLDSDAGPLLVTYTIAKADEKGPPFQPIPDDTLEKAKLKWLGFETTGEELGEKFHCSPKLLAELNPGEHWTRRRSGSRCRMCGAPLCEWRWA
jgi:hypothetical protein